MEYDLLGVRFDGDLPVRSRTSTTSGLDRFNGHRSEGEAIGDESNTVQFVRGLEGVLGLSSSHILPSAAESVFARLSGDLLRFVTVFGKGSRMASGPGWNGGRASLSEISVGGDDESNVMTSESFAVWNVLNDEAACGLRKTGCGGGGREFGCLWSFACFSEGLDLSDNEKDDVPGFITLA